ncbi:aconitase A isopropylmalate dehydratase small subunit swivel [Fusarium mundagurra]|uniref:Aconitase A isopropylmalate dehydratase small subunit swivel n=1 Tax=Fusarium mundagurra TaxID=1567541 RepID=A0A8H5Y6S0_9HYPO|nr:aconitase A isopropylmalate dehydratase small subunit swivel [Fusarium mundagurra]
MKFFSALTLTASSLILGTLAAPAPEPAVVGATVSPYSITCAGFNTGSTLSIGDIEWALSNRRDELDLKAGWWNQQELTCVSNDGRNIQQYAVTFTYNHARSNPQAMTQLAEDRVLCTVSSQWRMTCSPV